MSDELRGVTLTDRMVFQPRGASWVTEVDVARHEERRYVRKSYQSNMDLAKELHLEADVLQGGQDPRVPPPKPPRRRARGGGETEVLAISSPPRAPLAQTRSLLPAPEGPSITEAGSRVSSFAPQASGGLASSPPRRAYGHSRSKSEGVRRGDATEAGLRGPEGASPSGRASTLKLPSKRVTSPKPPAKYATSPRSPNKQPTSPRSPNKQPTSPRSPNKLATSPRSPTKQPTSPRSPNKQPTSPRSPNKLATSPRSPPKHAGGPRSPVPKSPTFGSSQDASRGVDERVSSPRPPQSEAEDGEKSSDGQFKEMLRELTAHKVMSGSDEGRGGRCPPASRQERYFAFSDAPRDASEPSSALALVRKSSFVSQDEVGSILEDKSLSSVARPLGDDTPFLDGITDALSHYFARSPPDERPEEPRERLKSRDSEKWFVANNDEGKIYYYEENGTKSLWKLPEVDDFEDSSVDEKGDSLNRPTSPPECLRISTILENLQELSENVVKEGFLHRTFLLRNGKKVRKNWTQSYARFIVGTFNSGSSGLIYFSKNRDEDKKAEIFEFFPTCNLEQSPDKKTSRQLVLGLRNGHDTEVLLQFDDKDIVDEWFKVLIDHEGMMFSDLPTLEKEDEKGKRGSDKIKREASVEHLNSDSKGITDKLRNFIKRRPLKETLEKKGIYRESVFGSTLTELSVQDKTAVPIFVLQCINHIEKSEENLRTDGLYRISGNAAQIQKIRFEVAQRNYSILSQEKEIHNLSGALKLFFRELKEPLIPFDNYQEFIQATGSEYRRMSQKLTKAVGKLPSENCDTLRVLLQHLLRVSEYESENRMSISNLAIVFGPCLLWPRVTVSHDLMTNVMLHNRIIEGLLADFSNIFPSKR